jgi:hypothetical protein
LDLGGDVGRALISLGVPGVAKALEEVAGGIVSTLKCLYPDPYLLERVSTPNRAAAYCPLATVLLWKRRC